MPKDCEAEGWEILTGFASLGGALAAPKCLRQVLAASLSSQQPGLSVREPVDVALGGSLPKPARRLLQRRAASRHRTEPARQLLLTAASDILYYPRKHTSKRVSILH